VFLRNPEREIPEGNKLVSPADGKIVDVLPFEENSVTLFKNDKRYKGIIHTLTSDVAEKGTIVSIFMSPLDVHYNRSPISGTIKSVIHTKGKFLPVNTLKAGLVNEKAEILIEGSDYTIKVVQIAGFLAKRIETFVEPGDEIQKGDIIGLINLGSQALLVAPDTLNIQIKKGEKVKAGESVLE
jgi:phosphatidylserine decarboxylase